MQTLRLSTNELEEAAKQIKAGEIVAFPTDTVYGLGADAANDNAVRKIFEAKGRPADRPLSVLVADNEDIKKYAKNIPNSISKLVDQYWPGPLTIILEKSDSLAPSVTAGKESVGLRMPDNHVALDFIRACQTPLAAPSANSTGRPSPTNAEHVLADLDGKISAIIDGGETSFGIESTVFDYSNPKQPTILRTGNVSKAEIEAIIGQEVFVEGDFGKASHSENTQTEKHYQPKIPVYIVESDWKMALKKMSKQGLTVGLLASDEVISSLGNQVEAVFSLGDGSNATQRLFSGLRTLENSEADVILAEPFTNSDLSIPYMNRLQNASAGKTI